MIHQKRRLGGSIRFDRTTSASRSRTGSDGFTLIETLLALVLIALVATLVLPWAPGQGRAALDGEARRVAALLRSDRNAARRAGVPVATQVDLAARTLASGASGVRVVLPRTIGLSLAAADPRRVIFGPDGGASAARFVLAAGGGAVAVRVRARTGIVEVGRP